MLIFQLLISALCTTVSPDVLITFSSSPNTPNIAEGDTAVYNCTSNHSSVAINWFFNRTVPALSLTSLGVTATGAGTTVSSLSVPGLVYPFNNTEIFCFASGLVAGIVNPPPVILRVQGPPGAVVDISVNFSSCTCYISWTAPFTLSGFPILQYNINVTNGTAAIYRANVTVTEWNYSPVEFGNYSVSTAAVNSVGEGEIATKHFSAVGSSMHIVHFSATLMRSFILPQFWLIYTKVTTNNASLDCITTVTLTSSTVSLVNTSAVTGDSLILDTMFSTSNTSIDNTEQSFSIAIYTSSSGHISVSNEYITIRFFDVYESQIISTDSTNVSIWCGFVQESLALGCHIILISSVGGNIYTCNISRLQGTGTVSYYIEPGQYTVYIYDIDYDGSIPSGSPAITLNNITITAAAAQLPSDTTDISLLTSPPQLLIMSSRLCCKCDVQTVTTSSSSSTVTIGGSLLGIASLLLVVTVLVHFIVIIIWCTRKTQLFKRTLAAGVQQRQDEEMDRQLPLPHPQYENIEMITATNTDISTNTCAAYGVVLTQQKQQANNVN